MELYVDLFLLENFILNYMVLCVTEIIIHRQKRTFGSIIGAFLGAIYALIAFYFGISDSGLGLMSKFAAAMCIVAFAFAFGGVGDRTRNFLKTFAAFYISSFIIAGAAFAILYCMGTDAEVVNGVIYWRGADNWLYILCCGFVAMIFVKILLHKWKQKSLKAGSIYKLKIECDQIKVECRALLDTGNDLHESVTGLPVVVINKSVAHKLFGKEYRECINAEPTEIIASGRLKHKKPTIVMFNSVGEECGAMLAFKATKVTIANKFEKQCYIAVSPNEIGKNDEYSALIGAELIT